MRWQRSRIVGLLLALASVPRMVAAQTTGAIAGTVKDTSGAVLPGVTVEAASPALIERVRTGISDAQGNYKIIDLRPGTYTVTFSLAGFSTLRREGLELSAGFTATANAEMKVGAIEETVVVTGASPIVDVQSARTQQVLQTEVIDALPAGGKSMMAFITMTLGANNGLTGRQDVGGDRGELSTGIVLHGGRGDDGRTNWDGMSTNSGSGGAGGKSRNYYFNMVAVQEVVVDTGGNTAESETGGANINMVPKEGGNSLKLYGAAAYTSSRFSAKAVPAEIAARGAGPQSSLKSIYDYGLGAGGRIRLDKAWFYLANRWWGTDSYGANNYFNKSINPFRYEPDLTRQAYTSQFYVDTSVRLTWQVAQRHKINQDEHLQNGCGCWNGIGAGALTAPEATIDFRYGPQVLSQTTWSYTASNRLLVQGGFSFLRQQVAFLNGIGANANRFRGTGTATFPDANTFSINELNTGYRWGALPGSTFNYGVDGDNNNINERFNISYVTGSHAFKAGAQTLQKHYDFTGMPETVRQVTYTLRGGLPSSLTEWAGPFQSRTRMTGVGLFAQDQWTFKGLTLNVGARFDQFEGHTLPLDIPAGQFQPGRHVDALENLPNFKDITPRLGVAYDVFGNGKTAIKGSFGKYLAGQGGALSQQGFAPGVAIVTNVTRTWADTDGNFVPDCNLQTLTANGECGQVSNLLFGQPFSIQRLADDARVGWNHREYNYQTSLQLQQELRPGLGIAVGYFHTSFGNLSVTQNTLVTAADFTEYCITAPTDARLGPSNGQRICGFYDVTPNKFGLVNNLVTLARNFGTPKEVYNGVDMGFNSRWGKGALLQGGITFGRETVDYCYANGRPDLTPQNFPANYPRTADYCRIQSPWWQGIGSQAKLLALYPLPWDFSVSGTFKNVPGLPVTASLVQGNAQVAPLLGRNLAAGATATVTNALIRVGSNGDTPQGTRFDLRLNQIDLRLTKLVRLGRSRVQGMFDVYNMLNNRSPQGINTTYGAAWLTPTSLLGGRLFKFSGQVDW